MKYYSFVTSQFEAGNYLRYKVLAASFEEACQKMSKLGLLKGHKLRRYDGKWEDCEVLGDFGDSMIWKSFREPAGSTVFFAAEDYWQPDSLTIIRQLDGYYTSIFRSRNLQTSVAQGLSLQEAWTRAKWFCGANKVEFYWK